MRNVLIALLFFALLLHGCNAVPQKAKMNAQAPELSAKTLNGDDIHLAQYAGKIVVLRFVYRSGATFGSHARAISRYACHYCHQFHRRYE